VPTWKVSRLRTVVGVTVWASILMGWSRSIWSSTAGGRLPPARSGERSE
jgi:hypothetical protein